MVVINVQRRLAAILVADVVGFSSLIGQDETGTLAAMKKLRTKLIDPRISEHEGRVFKTTGDGLLVEFPSVVNAVACAVEIQRGMAVRNADLSLDRVIEFRIGINMGDVVIEGEDVLGDGVNVAARLESIAPAGGVTISGIALDGVGNRLELECHDLGDQVFKNIATPVRVYQIEPVSKSGLRAEPADNSKPSIAVLPFQNMSGDPEQEYFSDGITEDIITDLSKVSGLTVVARNTVFTYKDQAVVIEDVAKKLKVGFVLEGSVRKSEGRVRITAQLVDGKSGSHIWAERYDRTLNHIFALQDEISKSIVEALKVRLLPEELNVISSRSTDSPDAYEALLMGKFFLYRGVEIRVIKVAKQLFAKAIDIDPNYARAYAAMAGCEAQLLLYGDPEASPEKVFANSTRALALDQDLADAHASHGWALHLVGRLTESEIEFERALALGSGSLEVYYYYGRARIAQGDYESGAAMMEKAIVLSPDDYRLFIFLRMAYVALGRELKAKEAAREGLLRVDEEIKARPDNTAALCAGAVMSTELGETDRALSLTTLAEMFTGSDIAALYNLGCCYAKLGQLERAIDCLEHQLSGSPTYIAARLPWMQNDSDLDSLREQPRYLALVARMEAKITTIAK